LNLSLKSYNGFMTVNVKTNHLTVYSNVMLTNKARWFLKFDN